MAGPVPIHTAVEISDSQFILAEPRAGRRSIIIFNDSTQYLYISYVTDISLSPRRFALRIPPRWYGTMPWGGVYTGTIYGIAETAVGLVQVTELVN